MARGKYSTGRGRSVEAVEDARDIGLGWPREANVPPPSSVLTKSAEDSRSRGGFAG